MKVSKIGTLSLAVVLLAALAGSRDGRVCDRATAHRSANARAVRPLRPRRSRSSQKTGAPVDDLAPVHAKLLLWLAMDSGKGPDHPRMLADLIGMLTDENVAQVCQTLSSQELRSAFGTAALARWLGTDAIGAAVWIAGRPDANEDQALLVAQSLVGSPEALARYCDELCSPSWRQQVLADASLEILEKDPPATLALAQHMDPGIARTNVMNSVAYQWSMTDLSAALSWMIGVKDDNLREQLIASSARAIATTDPDLAAQLLESAVPSSAPLDIASR